MQPLLIALSHKTGQSGAMDWLDHFLYSRNSLKKDPYVVLLGRGPVRASSTDSLLGAVLIYEYCFAGLPTGVFATDDVSGTRTVLAPPGSRLAVAHLAVRQLMRRSAAMVFASIDRDAAAGPEQPPPALAGMRIAQRTRWIPTSISLDSTIGSTLARFGARTRRNLRYYQRRAAAELGAGFVPHARLSREEFFALNRASTHPLPPADAVWRHQLLERSATRPTTLYAGLRSSRGQWLSVVWGERRDGIARIHWQMNHAGGAHHSFSIAMLAFLMEHEIALSASEILFVGGTRHSIRSSCASSPVTDILAVRRRSLRGWALRRFAQRLMPEANFLRGALQDEQMAWTTGPAKSWAGAGLHIF